MKEEVKEQEEKIPQIQFKSLNEANQKRGYKLAIYGDYATGKTHFALTAPEPIYIIDTEIGAAPLAYLFKDKDVKILDIAEKDGSVSFEKYQEAVKFLSKQKEIGTVIVDSATDIWAFAQEYAKTKIFKIKPQQRLAQQWDWGVINKLYLKELLTLIKLNCNLILTARAQEAYAGAGQPTGIFNPHWMKKTGYWVDFVLYNTKQIDKIGNLTFTTKVDKSRPVGKLMGKKFNNIDFNKFVEEVENAKKL